MPLYHFELGPGDAHSAAGTPICGDVKVRAATPELALARLFEILPPKITWASSGLTQHGEEVNVYIHPSKVRLWMLDAAQSAAEPEEDLLDPLAPGLGHFLASRDARLIQERVICTSRSPEHAEIIGTTCIAYRVVMRPDDAAEGDLPLLVVKAPDGKVYRLRPSEVFVLDADAAQALREIEDVFRLAQLFAKGLFSLASLDCAGAEVNRALFLRRLEHNYPADFPPHD